MKAGAVPFRHHAIPSHRTLILAALVCLGVWPFTIGLTGCASHRYNPVMDQRAPEAPRQSTEQRIEDKRTAERVREALAASLKYRYDGVQVAVSNGVVQLSGSVNTKVQRNSAGEIATQLEGVRSVENNIAVKD